MDDSSVYANPLVLHIPKKQWLQVFLLNHMHKECLLIILNSMPLSVDDLNLDMLLSFNSERSPLKFSFPRH